MLLRSSSYQQPGTRLGQADFVLTLLNVFHGELRDRIEAGARTMSTNAVVPSIHRSCFVPLGGDFSARECRPSTSTYVGLIG